MNMMERKEFERMAPELRERIIAMVMRMSTSSDIHMAEDVAQDTLLKLWTMRDRLDDYSNPGSLAMVIARNRAVDMLRSSRDGVTLPLEDGEMVGSGMEDPHERLIGREAGERLDAIMASLPSVQQAVMRMRHVEGMEISEIAAVTGSSPVAIRVALSRARNHVKQIFLKE